MKHCLSHTLLTVALLCFGRPCRERSKASEAVTAGARAAKDRSYQNSELDKALLENTEMREEMHDLHSDLDAYRDAVAELKGQLLDAGVLRRTWAPCVCVCVYWQPSCAHVRRGT